MDGWWDSDALDETICRLLSNNIDSAVKWNPFTFFRLLKAITLNEQNQKRAFDVGKKHYDVGNDLYEFMLDKRMTYTCGYWKNAKTLDEAQEAKLDLVCKKLGLKKGDRVLDIGCGWGSFLQFATLKYGIEGVGLTISKEQAKLAKERLRDLPVEIRLQDYRDVKDKFDHVVSLGMFEHVGYKNYRKYMMVVSNVLKDDGLFLLHTIGSNKTVFTSNPWINKYIFPNGMLPSHSQISKAVEGLFVIEDWHNFGADYDRTLMVWFDNFDKNWPKMKDKYGKHFYRMWKYYLLAVAGDFRSRNGSQLWQIVLSKNGVPGGYKSVR